jgi:uncharacterized protein (TIGR03435 family)
MSSRVLVALYVATAAAQIKAPIDKKFDAVSVKSDSPGKNPGACTFPSPTFSSPVEFAIGHCPLTKLISYAYGPLLDDQIAGAPNWAKSEWYAVSAKSASPVSIFEKYTMLQPVLEERFQLKWHKETRQLAVYNLSVSGPLKLQRTVPGSCRTWDPKSTPPVSDPKLPPACGVWRNRSLPDGGGTLQANGVTLAGLAGMMRSTLGREVVDTTGSEDLFDVHLEFANPALGSADDPLGGAVASGPSDPPSIFTALKNVGLTLKPGRGSSEVLVVDSVQKPTEN